jgi:hypothetical protein
MAAAFDYIRCMSKAAIGQALDLMRDLPDTDQEAVLQFLKELKHRQKMDPGSRASKPNPAIKTINGMLVFTGQIPVANQDWLKLIREEREQKILIAPLQTSGQ